MWACHLVSGVDEHTFKFDTEAEANALADALVSAAMPVHDFTYRNSRVIIVKEHVTAVVVTHTREN